MRFLIINLRSRWVLGPPYPPFVLHFFFSFVNVCRMVLRALLLQYIFFNKHFLIGKESVFEAYIHSRK